MRRCGSLAEPKHFKCLAIALVLLTLVSVWKNQGIDEPLLGSSSRTNGTVIEWSKAKDNLRSTDRTPQSEFTGENSTNTGLTTKAPTLLPGSEYQIAANKTHDGDSSPSDKHPLHGDTLQKVEVTSQSFSNVSLPPSQRTSGCNCTVQPCRLYCQRGLLVVHKHGHTLNYGIRNIIFQKQVEIQDITDHPRLGAVFRSKFEFPRTDYRHILVTRDLYAAFASGYLYHRSGKECWLDWYGKAPFKGWLQTEIWEPRVQDEIKRASGDQLSNFSLPHAEGRNLCRYLQEESEEDGMRTWTIFAWNIFMRPLTRFWTNRQIEESTQGARRTIHLCYEQQLLHFNESVDEMASFFGFTYDRSLIDKYHEKHDTASQSHGTSQDPDLRDRLRNVVQKLDEDLFDGAIARLHEDFGCKE